MMSGKYPNGLAGGRAPAWNRGAVRLGAAAVLVGCAGTGPVWAAESAAIEEVLVTAERRERSLQDTPIAATVLTDEALVEQGIDNIDEMQQIVPNVAINTYNRSTFINIRGVGIAQSAPTSNPGVAYYLDGVYIPHEQFIGHTFYDLASIEVLRGPQGTLTGQNSTGGAVYTRSPAPDFEAISGYVDQTGASDDWYRTVGAVNVPLGDTVAVRLAGIYENRDGFWNNIGPSGSEPGSSETTAVRVNLAFQPTAGQTYHLRYEHFDFESDNNPVKNRNDAVTDDPFTLEEDGRSYLNQKGYRASAEARIDVTPGIQFRAVTSYQDGDTKDQTDGDRTATAPAIPAGLPASGGNRAMFPGRVSRATTTFETFVTELNLLSIHEGPLQWVAGAFYMDENVPVELYRDNYSTTDLFQSNSDIITEAENTSKSVFGQVDYMVSEAWQLTLGLRYSDDQQKYTRFALPGPPCPCPYSNTQDSTETTGRVGVNYFASDDVMLYGVISKGYKAGGVNLEEVQGFFEPENNVVYEMGAKTTLSDGRLRLNGAVFFSDYTDIQFASLIALGGGPPLPVTQNAASADSWGVELEAAGVAGQFGYDFSLGYLNAEFAEDVILNNTNGSGNELVPEGSTLPFSPEWSFSAGIQYDFLMGTMRLTPRLQWSYTDEQIATPFPSPQTNVDSRSIVDLRVALVPNDNLRVEAFATNLLDDEYIASQIQNSSSADGGIIYGAPRQYGVRARYAF